MVMVWAVTCYLASSMCICFYDLVRAIVNSLARGCCRWQSNASQYKNNSLKKGRVGEYIDSFESDDTYMNHVWHYVSAYFTIGYIYILDVLKHKSFIETRAFFLP